MKTMLVAVIFLLAGCDASFPKCTLEDGSVVSLYGRNEGHIRARRADGKVVDIPWHRVKECTH